MTMSALGQKQTFLDVRFFVNDVRFTPESGHVLCATRHVRLSANSGHQILAIARSAWTGVVRPYRPFFCGFAGDSPVVDFLAGGDTRMRIAAMAAGAVGGYFGARMAAAGHDVMFIARGAHLDAIRKNGLKIESVLGDLHLPKPNVTDDPARSGRSTSCCLRSSLGHRESARRADAAAGRPRHPRHHLAKRRRQRRAHGADPRR